LLRGGVLCLTPGLLVWFWAVDLAQPVAMQISARRNTTTLRSILLYSGVFCSLWVIRTNMTLGRSGDRAYTQLANWLNAMRIDTFRIYPYFVLWPGARQGSHFPWLCVRIGKA